MEKWTVHLRTNKLTIRNALLLVISTTSRLLKFTNLASATGIPRSRSYTRREIALEHVQSLDEKGTRGRVKTCRLHYRQCAGNTDSLEIGSLVDKRRESDIGLRNEYGHRVAFLCREIAFSTCLLG